MNKIVRGKGTQQPVIKTAFTIVSLEAWTVKKIVLYLIQK